MEKVISQAYNISAKALKNCFADHGYYAALNHFRDYWARDAFFASFGTTYMKDFARVKRQLLFFIKYQKKSGHIPRLIPKNPLTRFIFMNLEIMFDNPFLSPFLSYFSRDQNSLFVISSWQYVKKSSDKDFAKKYFDNFERAINWNFKYDIDKDLLLEQEGFSDWEDSVLRKNPESLFTNICSYKALTCLSKLAKCIGNNAKRKQYNYMSKIVKEQINLNFWTGSFYTDSVKCTEKGCEQKDPVFSGASNMLAVYWGVADLQKGKQVMNFVKDHNLEHFSVEVNYPTYPDKNILFVFRLMGIKDYHNGMAWLWVGCFGVLAYLKINEKEKAMHLLRKIARKIVEFDEVYEVYEPTGEPVKRRFYESAYPFAWSAGIYIYTIEKLKRWKP